MGGGLAFLNKKGWHPGSLRNLEKVWAKEQEHDAEQRKLEELKEAYETERQQEELRGLAKKAGLKQGNDSMDWMYKGGVRPMQSADSQAQTSGISAAQQQAEPAPVQLPAFLAEDTPASANEVWVRLHSDPLFSIRQQEIAARKSVMANPVKMDAVRQQAELAARQKELAAKQKSDRKQAKKEAKAAKRAKKQARREKQPTANVVNSSSDSGHDGDEREAKRARTGTYASPPAHRQEGNVGSQRWPDRHADREERDHRHASQNDRSHADSHRAPRSATHDADSRARLHEADRGNSNSHTRAQDREQATQRHRANSDAMGPEGKGSYGLRMSAAAPKDVAEIDRSAAVASTRTHLEMAAAAKEEKERLKASQKYERKEYKVGRFTEEERVARLAEMTGNANVHEEARWQRLSTAHKEDQKESRGADLSDGKQAVSGEQGAHGAKHEDYMKNTMREMYGKGCSVEDQVGRRKYYSERGSDRAAFRR